MMTTQSCTVTAQVQEERGLGHEVSTRPPGSSLDIDTIASPNFFFTMFREHRTYSSGNYFEGRFPVMIRRQKVFKGGTSPSLSVDFIGGDRAATSTITPRSTRVNCGGGGSVSIGFGGGSCGGDGDDDDGIAQPLTPLDLTVGQQVLLMKRSMTVCGWDETAHVWWEKMTGESRRGIQTERSGRGGDAS